MTLLQSTPTRRIEVSCVELCGEQRLALYEHERRGQRWAPTRYGFTVALELLPELISVLQALRGASDTPGERSNPTQSSRGKPSVKPSAIHSQTHGDAARKTAGKTAVGCGRKSAWKSSVESSVVARKTTAETTVTRLENPGENPGGSADNSAVGDDCR